MSFELNAIVRFPDNIFGSHPISEFILDTTNGDWKIGYRLIEELPIVSSIEMSPEVMRQQHDMAAQQRLVKIKCIVETEDSHEAWLLGTKEIEALCSWLSFLCLKPFQVTHWDAVIGGTASRIVSSKMPNIPDDYNPLIVVSAYTPPMNYNLSEWLLNKLPGELLPILKWFRKGNLAMHLEEKMIFWVTAMEGISEALAVQKPNRVKCPECNHEVAVGPSASKTGLLDFIRDVLGYSRNKVYEPIWELRSKYVHAAFVAQDRYTKEDLKIFEDATQSLAVASISYFILNRTTLPFKNRQEIINEGYKNSHPFLGKLPWLQDNMNRLVERNKGSNSQKDLQ